MAIDLSTNFGGLHLRSPIIVGDCPMTANAQNRIAMENAGVGAIVLPSLLEEHVIAWKARQGGSLNEREQRLLGESAKITQGTLIPDVETYLAIVNRASVQSGTPVIASLNGQSDGDWLDFAGELQDAGANAIELNVHHGNVSACHDPRQLEDKVVQLAKTINESITVPQLRAVAAGRHFRIAAGRDERLRPVPGDAAGSQWWDRTPRRSDQSAVGWSGRGRDRFRVIPRRPRRDSHHARWAAAVYGVSSMELNERIAIETAAGVQ